MDSLDTEAPDPISARDDSDPSSILRDTLDQAPSECTAIVTRSRQGQLIFLGRTGLSSRLRLALMLASLPASDSALASVSLGVVARDEVLPFSMVSDGSSKSKQKNAGPIVSTRQRHDEQARRQLRVAKSRR